MEADWGPDQSLDIYTTLGSCRSWLNSLPASGEHCPLQFEPRSNLFDTVTLMIFLKNMFEKDIFEKPSR